MSLTLDSVCKIIDIPLFASNYTHILEFGIWRGDSISKIRRDVDKKYQIYGFDSFLGLPEDWIETGYKKGDFKINDRKFIDELKNRTDIKIFEGWFKDTIPEYLKEAQNIALLHIDCDLYSSTIDILYSDIRNYIKPGTFIVFDDWKYLAINRKDTEKDGLHNQKAFKEWAKDFNIEYKLLNKIEEFRQALIIL